MRHGGTGRSPVVAVSLVPVTLNAGSSTADILPYGARIMQLRFSGRPVFVAYDEPAQYVADEPYVGAILGRTSGRIANARLTVDGQTHALAANEGGHHLHGGPGGFGVRDWTVAERGEDRLVLTLTSDDADQGYPGRVTAKATFTLTPDAFRVDYEAVCDAPTPISLTHHPYVRLSGNDALDHSVQTNADRWTPLTEAGIPTGKVADVADTPLDMRGPVRIGDVIEALNGTLDHGVVCPGGVRVRVSDGANALTITSNHTHCQLYGAGTVGAPLGRYMGLAVEPQGWPDAERHEGFEDRIVRPGQTYRRHVVYQDG